MSFLRKLFGLQGSAEAGEGEAIEHEGYMIRPAPMAEGGQFRLCAVIARGGRADKGTSHDPRRHVRLA
jgi:hypothetical protein